MNNIPYIDLVETGKNIIKLRKDANLSVRDIQDVMGFSSPQAIYQWQRGGALPTVDNLLILAMLFHVKVDDILILEGHHVEEEK